MSPRDDDQDWMQALAGRPPDGADPETLREAAWLREAHRRWPADLPLEQPTEADMIALVQRGRREAGAPPARPARSQGGWRRWFFPAPLAGAAVAALLVVALVPWTGDETLRGGGPVQVQQADPVAARAALAAELRAAGVDVRLYERGGRWGLDAVLPTPVPPAVARILTQRALPVPTDGALVIEFSRTTGQP